MYIYVYTHVFVCPLKGRCRGIEGLVGLGEGLRFSVSGFGFRVWGEREHAVFLKVGANGPGVWALGLYRVCRGFRV